MADEPNTPPNEPVTPPLTNSPESRNPDGSLKEATSLAAAPTATPTPEPKPEPKAEPKAEPAAYTEFTAPEGYELDKATLDKAIPIFKELGLNQEQAQKLVSFYGEAALSAENAPYEAYETMRDGWRKEIIADRTLGNGKDGLSPETQKHVSDAIASLPADLQQPFRDAMTMTGAGDHPAFIRAWDAIGAMVGEGKLVIGRGPSPAGQNARGGTQPTAAQALYPALPSNAR